MELTWIIGFAVFILFMRLRALEQRNARLENMVAGLITKGDTTTERPTAPETQKAMPQPEMVGDWPKAQTPATIPADSPHQTASEAQNPSHFVFNQERFAAAANFIKTNWFYLVAAVSLAFAGIFFIQYGIENGLLPPEARVICALLFGAALIGAGEWLRRKGGDEAGDINAFLPSVFASAGIITLFAAILGARQLYGLIGVELAFGGLIAIAALAILIGWHYGALLTLIGLIGAVATPFIVGGESETVHLLYVYFALILAVGLSVDALKRSAFVSVTALAVPTIGAVLIFLSDQTTAPFFIAYGMIAWLGALFLPFLPNAPLHQGPMALGRLHHLGPKNWPDFPERLALGATLAFIAITLIAGQQSAQAFWVAIVCLSAIMLISTYVLRKSPSIDDLALLLFFTMPVFIAIHGLTDGQAAKIYTNQAQLALNPSPMDISILMGFGAIGSLLGAWRSIRNTPYPLIWAFAAASFGPIMTVAIGLFWQPLWQHSATEWAFHITAITITLSYIAICAQKWFDEGDPRASIFAFAALAMLGYSVSVIFTETALTLTLAFIVLLAALLDRRYNMRFLAIGAQLGVAVVSYRLIADPGVIWAIDAPILQIVLAYFGSVGLLAATWQCTKARGRIAAMITLESAIVTLSAIGIVILLIRFLDYTRLDDSVHLGLSLVAMIWLISAAGQLYRLKPQGTNGLPKYVRWVRWGLAIFFGLIATLLFLLVLTILSPLEHGGRVIGLAIINSLIIAYLLPALVLGAMAYFFDHLGKKLRLFLAGFATLFLVAFIGLEIRHFWLGERIYARYGVLDRELYSYTIAMLLAGTALLLTALYRHADRLRKVGLVVIGLTVLKVFFIDMAGLTGLTRIFSFLALGLVLAGLAWLNRWMITRDGQAKPSA